MFRVYFDSRRYFRPYIEVRETHKSSQSFFKTLTPKAGLLPHGRVLAIPV